jgi:hypothetical protein
MEWQNLCHTIEQPEGIIVHASCIVTPMDRCESFVVQQTDIRPPKEKEPWRRAKVCYDNKKKQLLIKCQKLSFSFKRITNDAVWCHEQTGDILLPLTARSSELIDCMLDQYKTNLRRATHTLAKVA